MSAETPDTPATTWPTEREADELWEVQTGQRPGSLNDWIRRQVAAREAAAREEGRAELRDAAHLVAKSHAEQIRQLRAEVEAAERQGAELVKGLAKAVKNPTTEWVDANIVRLLLRNAQADGGVS
jgi:hypothetical protein